MRTAIKYLVSIAAGFAAGLCCTAPRPVPAMKQGARVIVHDTVRIVAPAAAAATALPPRRAVMAVAAHNSSRDTACDTTADSVTVSVPVESVEYSGDGYRAWVSGWQPSLDSLRFDRITAIPAIEPPHERPGQRRFSVGIQAGYGITPRGVQPYVGIGVAYRIF